MLTTLKLSLLLRLKILNRMFCHSGFLVCIIMIVVIALLLFIVYSNTNKFFTLSISIFLLFMTDNRRSDKQFLSLTFENPRYIMMADYLVLSLPFLIICMLKGEWWQMITIIFAALLLPYLHNIRFSWKRYLPLPFMYRGGIDLLYSIRIIWWLCPFLLIGVIMGIIHDNINLSIVCIMLWTSLICISMRDPIPLVLYYKGLRPFVKENINMVIQDAVIWLTPLLVAFFFSEGGILMSLRLLLSGFISIISFVFMRYAISNMLFIFFHAIILIALYVFSVFCLWGYPMQILAIITYIMLSKNKYYRLWN